MSSMLWNWDVMVGMAAEMIDPIFGLVLANPELIEDKQVYRYRPERPRIQSSRGQQR